MKKQISKAQSLPNKFNYVAFLLAAIFFAISRDFSTALIFGGIGLVFDPFNQDQPFAMRPGWQKGWLIVHVGLVLGLIGVDLLK